MPLTIGHIILFSDDRWQASKFKELFLEFQPAMTVQVVEKYQQLLTCIEKRLPDMVIIHVSGSNRPMISWLKKLRSINAMEGVPVIIYNGETPDRENFLKVFDF